MDLTSKSTINIKFKKDNVTTTADFSLVNHDGNYYGRLSLDKYMIRYASERFLDIELVTASKSGIENSGFRRDRKRILYHSKRVSDNRWQQQQFRIYLRIV